MKKAIHDIVLPALITFGLLVVFFLIGALAGREIGAMNPIEYTTTVKFEKVLGWCMIASIEDLTDAGMTHDQVIEVLPKIREGCEDRWLAFSKRWEREGGVPE